MNNQPNRLIDKSEIELATSSDKNGKPKIISKDA